MLTVDQKEAILRAAGIAVPPDLDVSSAGQQLQADARSMIRRTGQADGVPDPASQRERVVDALFNELALTRAARSLQADDDGRGTGGEAPSWGGPIA